MSDLIKNATVASFEQDVLKADKPVLVDYWAPWCGPCKMMAPVLDEIADERAESLQVVKVDVQDHPDIAAQYGIRGIPTLMLFKDGQSVATKVGAVSKADLLKFIDSNL